MTFTAFRRGLLVGGAILLGLLGTMAGAQDFFYQEVEKDGRIYVFAKGARYEAFQKSGGAEIGVAISRPAYGPQGETVIFDSEDAINYYNFKHSKPGEVFQKPKEVPKSPYPSGKVNGLVFGDYYYFADHHDDKFDNQQGFWMRRAYLGYDPAFSETLSARLRLEMNSNGKLEGGNAVPYVKDAYVTWKYSGKHQARLGIQPSLTFDSEEGFWGLRHIEKTPADLYRIDSSRDFGLSFSGPLGDSGLSYGGQFGNDSGNGSETDKYKIVRFLGLYEGGGGLRVEGIFNFGARPNGQDRTTAKGLLGFKNKSFRAAGEYLWQERKSGKETPDTKIGIWSAFVVWDFSPKKASLFGRFDKVKGELGSVDVGLPGADGIDYLVLSTASPFKTYIFGLEYYIHPSVRISPNVEIVSYDESSVSKDVVPRLTFYWNW
jgi:hypothetical protein